MRSSKIAISVDEALLGELDRLVDASVFQSRSQAIQAALIEKLDRLKCRRLARECAKLDPKAEQSLADEGLAHDACSWPA
jgi:metal-responsive CopG/Arc/MetJ family transcriptional regulator